MKASKELARLHIALFGVARKASTNEQGILTIGINHTNQDFKQFNDGDSWSNELILEAWKFDIAWAESMANLWLNCNIPQCQFDSIVDLLLDEAFQYGYRPYTLLDMCKAQDDNTCDQFLRWIIDKDGQVTIDHMRRAFCRRAMYLGFDFKNFLKPQGMINSLETLNLAIKPYGFRAIHDTNVGFSLQRFKQC